MSFLNFDFAPAIAENIKRLGYETPTPIQQQTIPLIMTGADVVGQAQTGTGKTAAFVLPLLQKLCTGQRHRTRVLILGPTRELAEQTTSVIHQLGRGTQLHTAMIFGGISYKPQIDAVRRGAEIIVACPGRLLDHLRQRNFNLGNIETVVLDEADQMFDMGFLPDVRQILKSLPTQRQTLLFSATIAPEVRKLVQEFLRAPKYVQIAMSAPVETVTHAIFPVLQERKADLLLEIMKQTDTGPVIIFTRTRHRAKRLAAQLVKSGYRATDLQGQMSQSQRTKAMEGFRAGRFQIMVATDLAARGIDVSDISHVINFDIPATVDAYTHRIGRTGRAAKTGDAFTLVTREDADLVRQIERVLKAPLPRKYMDGFDSGVAAGSEHAAAKPSSSQHRGGGQRRPPAAPRMDGTSSNAHPNARGSGHVPGQGPRRPKPAGHNPWRKRFAPRGPDRQ